MPALSSMDPKPQLIFITCGNTRAVDAWQSNTGFPTEKAFLDQQGVFYSGLKTHYGIYQTLFSPRMW
ncbi:hypothetical protein DUNSADRAFT_4480 [Dunaliella salina]|uniref:Uncharacterized protein n=1 Tax=Dunaliella salina TaxID=3046 RepID=A0ABQ7GRZ4_DUNSA|nr:hypothetical protein DUNSADRAFT_4480 [Dunaliella salina]|eukprot:KAF5837376.1 hypothetical protein DUNSADRAFT_4480 [Dunaliella salina]